MNWTQQDWMQWATKQLWKKAMQECPQEPEWHAEGDVWTHTEMVMEELLKISEFQTLSQQEQSIVAGATLLHDIGKPNTTKTENGRITSSGHSVRGAFMVRKILRDRDVDIEMREAIFNLVRYHSWPMRIIDKKHPDLKAIDLSWRVPSSQMIYILAKADMLGRKAGDKNDMLARVELFKELCQKNNCFVNKYRFKNDHARFLFFRGELNSLQYAPYEDFSCEVTMISGLPGSGKDFWIKNNPIYQPVVSLDSIRIRLGIAPTDNQGRVRQRAKEQVRRYLRQKESFIFNATNVTEHLRGTWIKLFHEYGASIKIVYIEPPFEQLLAQNSQREEAVPEKVIHKLFNKLEVPNLTECHCLEWFSNQ